MLEANIKISDDLAKKGRVEASKRKMLKLFLKQYASLFFLTGLLVSVVDLLGGKPTLILIHIGVLFLIFIYLTWESYRRWPKEMAKLSRGWSFNCKLDENGVIARADELYRSWDFYDYYIEHDDYIAIFDKVGEVSFIPKSDGLQDIIEFTKRMLPNKAPSGALKRAPAERKR